MSVEAERIGKQIGEWTLILGALLMPLVILTKGYRVAMVPKFFVFVTLVLALGIALLLTWKSTNWKRAPFALPWVLFLMIAGVQALRSLNTDAAVEVWIIQVCGGIVGIGSALLVGQFLRVCRAVAIAGVVVALLGILEYVGLSWQMFPSGGRPSATLGFRNIAGMYLAVSLFLSGSLLLQSQKKDQILGVVSATMMIVFLVFTRTRGAWLGVFVGSLCGFFIVWRVMGLGEIFKWFLQHKVALISGCGVVVITAFIPPHFQDQSLSRLDEKKASVVQSIQFITQEGGDRGRFKMWYHTLQMIADAPLIGVGLHNWSAYYPRYDQGDVMGMVVAPRRPHNDFLWIWAELGTVGLLVYLWLLLCVAKRVWARSQLRDWGGVLAGLGAVALLVHSGFSFPREQPVAVFFLSLALGMAGQGAAPDAVRGGWRYLALGSVVVAVGFVGVLWSWAIFRFDADFSRTLQAKDLFQPEKQVEASRHARLAGVFDHRVFLLEGLGRYDLGDFKGAVDVYQTYLQYQPYLPALHNNLGRAYEALGNDVAAEKAYLNGLRTFSGDGAGVLVSNLAAVYKRQGKVDQALDLYEIGIGLPAEGYHNLGLIYAERGLWDQSLEAYQHALAQAPDMTIVFFSMAGVHLLQGDVEAASRNYETFLEHWTGKPDYVRDAQHRLRQVYPVLGDRYLRAGQIDQAVSVFTRLIDMGAGSAAIYNNLVLLYGRLRQYDKAIAMGEACQNLYPDFVQIHLSLATVYEDQKNTPQARYHYLTFINNSSKTDPLVGRAQERVKNLAISNP